jgi:hypothetical protein
MTTQIDAPTDVDQFRCAVATDVAAASVALGDKLGRWTAQAGFSSFRRATGTPFNRIFEVRP